MLRGSGRKGHEWMFHTWKRGKAMMDENSLLEKWDKKLEKWNGLVVTHAHHMVPYQRVSLGNHVYLQRTTFFLDQALACNSYHSSYESVCVLPFAMACSSHVHRST